MAESARNPTEFHIYDLTIHRRTGTFYRIQSFVRMRIGEQWESGVLYSPIDEPNTGYVRELGDFIAAFALAKDYRP